MLSDAMKETIAREAEMLRACVVYEINEGLALLKARYGVLLPSWKSYSYFYFAPTGEVYGSSIAPATLYVFELFKSIENQRAKQLLQEFIGNIYDCHVGHILATRLVDVVGGEEKVHGLYEELWSVAVWPSPPLLDLVHADLPEIQEKWIENGSITLVGYGALVLSLEGSAEWRWYRTRDAAENARRQSVSVQTRVREIQKHKLPVAHELSKIGVRIRNLGLVLSYEFGYFHIGTSRYEYNPRGLREAREFIERKEKEKSDRALRNAKKHKKK